MRRNLARFPIESGQLQFSLCQLFYLSQMRIGCQQFFTSYDRLISILEVMSSSFIKIVCGAVPGRKINCGCLSVVLESVRKNHWSREGAGRLGDLSLVSAHTS